MNTRKHKRIHPWTIVYVFDVKQSAPFKYECRMPKFIAERIVKATSRRKALMWLDWTDSTSDLEM